MNSDTLLRIVELLLAGAAVYGGIRADLRNLKESVTRAHVRIDNHIENHP